MAGRTGPVSQPDGYAGDTTTNRIGKSISNRRVAVVQDEEKPIDVSVLAEAIIRIDKATRELLSSGLKFETLVVLLHNSAPGVGRPAIRAVLQSLQDLRKDYCTR